MKIFLLSLLVATSIFTTQCAEQRGFGGRLVLVNPTLGQVNLAWDPVISTPTATLAGYKVYWGTASGAYTQSVDVGEVTTYTITGLTKGQTYYFAATAYDTTSLESGYSNEVSTTID